MARLKVLYILGPARSGSSLFASLLGELDGFFAAGEMRLIWKGLESRLCGCGRPVRECSIWSPVVSAATTRLEPSQIETVQRRTTRTRHTPRHLFAAGASRDSPAKQYLRLMTDMYLGLSEATGAGVIVDSSKSPAEAALLRQSSDIDAYVVHVTRDPRAVVYSWQRAGRRQKPGAARKSLLRATASWWSSNAAAELVRNAFTTQKAAMVRYEDYVLNPVTCLSAIASLVGHTADAAAVFQDGVLDRSSRHMVGGNALRFDPHRVALKPDLEWVGRLHPGSKAAVTALTVPALVHYGYAVRARSAPPGL